MFNFFLQPNGEGYFHFNLKNLVNFCSVLLVKKVPYYLRILNIKKLNGLNIQGLTFHLNFLNIIFKLLFLQKLRYLSFFLLKDSLQIIIHLNYIVKQCFIFNDNLRFFCLQKDLKALILKNLSKVLADFVFKNFFNFIILQVKDLLNECR